MNGLRRVGGVSRMGFLAVLLCSAVSAKADPVVIGEGPPRLEAVIPVILAVLAEAYCVQRLLRRWRRPGLFILWLMLMHLFTYPLFLGVLWLCWGLHPVLGVTIGEGTIVLVEGCFIYLLCRFLAPARSELPVPSITRSLFASFFGNICSAAAFPLLIWLCQNVAYLIGAPILD
jgi:hypothetical protein